MGKSEKGSGQLHEPLTRRECNILAHLANGKSSQEIAELETLAQSSVKWYLHQVYAKLEVNRRSDAITRARELGLLVPVPAAPEPAGEKSPEFSHLPTGIVTFLFTDIEGSTPLWEQHPLEMTQSSALHHWTLHSCIEANGGIVTHVIGDAFQAAFRLATDGLCAALAAQKALAEAQWPAATGPIKVRMGLHTGPAELDPQGNAPYAVSHTLNRAARVMGTGYGGQVLLSQEAKDLVERDLPEGVSLVDMGEHHLKGMQKVEHLYQVMAPGLRSDFPPLPTAIRRPNNLPVQLTSFIGREKEITAVGQLLEKHRLVTLTGSGGTGKTRLALQVADGLLEDFPDGVWVVELAPLVDPDLVSRTTAQVLGLHEDSHVSIDIVLAGYLESKRLLLILDNCEHLLAECSRMANLLLKKCPMITLMATSREILGIAGERPFRVPSLEMPDPKHMLDLEEMACFDAVRLFVERAEQASPGFVLDNKNASSVATICRRLDGIPLAIELAAARIRVMAPQQIASRLDNVFRLLTGGSRSVLPRQQTLKAAIDWSYNLLSVKERLALQRLSVFAGSWTLEGAESVAAGEDIAPFEVLDLLTSLVDKSLAQPSRSSESLNRYRMLETVRQYAYDRLLESGDVEVVRNKHLAHYLELALQAEPYLRGKGQRMWSDRLDEELDNLRLALEWAMSSDIEKGLQLATTLERFWHIRNYWIEGVSWLEMFLVAEAGESAIPIAGTKAGSRHPARSIARGKALNASGGIRIDWSEIDIAYPQLEEARNIFQGYSELNQSDLAISLGNLAFIDKDLDRAIYGLTQSLDLLRKAEDNYHLTRYLHFLANLYVAKGDLKQARVNSEECLALSRPVENVDRVGRALGLLGCLEMISGNPSEAASLFAEAQSCFDKLGSRIYSASMMNLQAYVAMSQGDYRYAIQRSEAALAVSIEMNNKVMMMNTNSFLGWEAWALKDYDQANRQCQKGLDLAKELRLNLAIIAEYVLGRVAISTGEYTQADVYLKELLVWLTGKTNPFWINFVWSPYGFKGMYYPTYEAIHALGVLAGMQHHAQRATVLFGAQNAQCGWLKNILSLAERIEFEQTLVSTRLELGEIAFTNAWEAGQAMTREKTVSYALEDHE